MDQSPQASVSRCAHPPIAAIALSSPSPQRGGCQHAGLLRLPCWPRRWTRSECRPTFCASASDLDNRRRAMPVQGSITLRSRVPPAAHCVSARNRQSSGSNFRVGLPAPPIAPRYVAADQTRQTQAESGCDLVAQGRLPGGSNQNRATRKPPQSLRRTSPAPA
jgi:hypothetical protein